MRASIVLPKSLHRRFRSNEMISATLQWLQKSVTEHRADETRRETLGLQWVQDYARKQRTKQELRGTLIREIIKLLRDCGEPEEFKERFEFGDICYSDAGHSCSVSELERMHKYLTVNAEVFILRHANRMEEKRKRDEAWRTAGCPTEDDNFGWVGWRTGF